LSEVKMRVKIDEDGRRGTRKSPSRNCDG